MYNHKYITKASEYLKKICSVKPNRRTGSPGNREATNYFAEIVKQLGYSVDTNPFNCLDYKSGQVSLTLAEKKYIVLWRTTGKESNHRKYTAISKTKKNI